MLKNNPNRVNDSELKNKNLINLPAIYGSCPVIMMTSPVTDEMVITRTLHLFMCSILIRNIFKSSENIQK